MRTQPKKHAYPSAEWACFFNVEVLRIQREELKFKALSINIMDIRHIMIKMNGSSSVFKPTISKR